MTSTAPHTSPRKQHHRGERLIHLFMSFHLVSFCSSSFSSSFIFRRTPAPFNINWRMRLPPCRIFEPYLTARDDCAAELRYRANQSLLCEPRCTEFCAQLVLPRRWIGERIGALCCFIAVSAGCCTTGWSGSRRGDQGANWRQGVPRLRSIRTLPGKIGFRHIDRTPTWCDGIQCPRNYRQPGVRIVTHVSKMAPTAGRSTVSRLRRRQRQIPSKP